ncbi:MAG: hypothetical protein ACRDFB_08760, partial [Rhabdochlamydiaceae bacterium]
MPDKDQLSEVDLKNLIQKNLTDRCENAGQQSVIDHAISIDKFPCIKAWETWDKVWDTSKIVCVVSTMAGLAIFAVGTWQLMTQRSPLLKVLGTVVLIVAAICFNSRAHKLGSIANGSRNLLITHIKSSNNWINKIACFRKDVILKGLQEFEACYATLPEELKKQPGIEFFTDKEIKMLLKEWTESITKQYPMSAEFGEFIAGHNLFEPVFKGLPQDNSIRQAIETYNIWKSSLSESSSLAALNKLRDDTIKVFQYVYDKTPSKKSTFTLFCNEANQNGSNRFKTSRYHVMGEFFLQSLELLFTQPDEAKTSIEMFKIDASNKAFIAHNQMVVSSYFKIIFNKIFESSSSQFKASQII